MATTKPPMGNQRARFRSAQFRVLILTWIAYVAFNVARKVTSVVKRRLQVELKLSTTLLGALDTAFLIAYTCGQFINGPLGDKLGARAMVSGGLFGTAVVLYFHGTVSVASTLVALAFVHGCFQSCAFAACVKTLTPWLAASERGTKMGLWNTCSPFGGVAGTAIGTALLGGWGWRAAFQLPALPIALLGMLCQVFLVDSPAAQGFGTADEVMGEADDARIESGTAVSTTAAESSSSSASSEDVTRPGCCEVLRLPGLIFVALGYFFLKFMRYLLLFWLPFYHTVELGLDEASAGYLSTTFEIGGVFGTVAIGWLSDRIWGGRRTLASMWMMVGAAGALLAYMAVGTRSLTLSSMLMALIGVLVLGPDSVMSATICQDLGQRSRYGSSVVGTITGIVNGCGSAGSILQGLVTGWVSQRYGWGAVFHMLVLMSILTALALVPAVTAERAATVNAGAARGASGSKSTAGTALRRYVVWFTVAIVLVFVSRTGMVTITQESTTAELDSMHLPPFQLGTALPEAPKASHGRVACCSNTYELPGLLARSSAGLSPGQRLLQRIYRAEISEAHLSLPQGMQRKLDAAGADAKRVATQQIVNVINVYLPHETSSHNKVRKQRFGNTVDASSNMAEVRKDIDALHNCTDGGKQLDFCFPKNYVALDSDTTPGQYVEGARAIIGANMGAYTGSHALIITKHTANPMLLSLADYTDMFKLAQRFVSLAHARFPRRRFAAITFDTLHGGGASQMHPHFQVWVMAGWYPGKWEAMQQAARRYTERTKGNYYTDVFAAHAAVGLAFAGTSGAKSLGTATDVGGFVSMTSATGLEIVLMSGDGGSDSLARLFHNVLHVCYNSLGWTQISTSCMFPPLGRDPQRLSAKEQEEASATPFMCRLVTRGAYFSHTNDVSANELFASTIVGNDIFEVANVLRVALRKLQPNE